MTTLITITSRTAREAFVGAFAGSHACMVWWSKTNERAQRNKDNEDSSSMIIIGFVVSIPKTNEAHVHPSHEHG
jgi:hypothetical protein